MSSRARSGSMRFTATFAGDGLTSRSSNTASWCSGARSARPTSMRPVPGRPGRERHPLRADPERHASRFAALDVDPDPSGPVRGLCQRGETRCGGIPSRCGRVVSRCDRVASRCGWISSRCGRVAWPYGSCRAGISVSRLDVGSSRMTPDASRFDSARTRPASIYARTVTRRIVVFLGARRQRLDGVEVLPLEDFLAELPG